MKPGDLASASTPKEAVAALHQLSMAVAEDARHPFWPWLSKELDKMARKAEKKVKKEGL